MRLLIDMNLSPKWAGFLVEHGHDAEHWSFIGSATADDSEIAAYAKKHNWIIVTHDLDFSAILAATQGEKPSVVQIRSDDVSLEAISTQVLNALSLMEDELQEGALVTIDPTRTRLRLLPLL